MSTAAKSFEIVSAPSKNERDASCFADTNHLTGTKLADPRIHHEDSIPASNNGTYDRGGLMNRTETLSSSSRLSKLGFVALFVGFAVVFGLTVGTAGAEEDPAADGDQFVTTTTLDPVTMSESDREARISEIYKPDPSSPPTTIPQPPKGPQVEDLPERYITVSEIALSSEPGEALAARRTVIDAETGQIVAVAEPGQPLAPPGEAQTRSSVQYQSDRVFLNDNTTQDVYNTDLWVYIGGPQCSDSDSCSGGIRKTSGYVWYTAMQVNIGNSPSDCRYQMHGGIAMGNGIDNDWYFSWGGYTCGGTSLGPGSGNGISLDNNKWYRIRIWRLAPSGNNWPWGAWVMDWNIGQERYAGSWTLNDGRMISNALYFTEIAEPSVCATDYTGTHNLWVEYRDPSGEHIYTVGTANYQATCTNTNLRDVGTDSNRYTIDDRETTRTNANGYILF